ncbi:hypothetical protein BS78_07G144300 [Paspalum vaginatum]|nr:hypothetical protein BS78_07G144300 [Paspalum vaginatum]KAJ1268560.1 hypothetical protein BS78_07G144300 [Paspalum vaginatum]
MNSVMILFAESTMIYEITALQYKEEGNWQLGGYGRSRNKLTGRDFKSQTRSSVNDILSPIFVARCHP